MKTVQLVECLTANERRSLESTLQTHIRPGLLHLFRAIKHALEHAETVRKEDLFKAAFDKPYTSSKDYLLRNELRLLNKELTDFIAIEEFRQACKKNPYIKGRWLQDAYKHRKQVDLFSEQFNKLQEGAHEHSQWEYLAHSAWQAAQLLYLTEDNFKAGKYEKLINYYQKAGHMHARQFVHALRESELVGTWATSELRLMQRDIPFPPQLRQVDLTDPQWNDDYSLSVLYKTLAMTQEVQAKFKALKLAYEHLGRANVYGKDHQKQKLIILSDILSCLSISRDIENWEKYYHIFKAEAEAHPQAVSTEIATAFVDWPVSRKNYAEVVENCLGLDKHLLDSPRMRADYMLITNMARILTGDCRAAQQAAIDMPNFETVRQRAFQRFILLAAEFLSGNLDEAERRQQNLQHMLHYNEANNNDNQWFFETVKLIGRLLKYSLLPGEEAKIRWQELQKDVAAIDAENVMVRTAHLLPYHWLVQQFERLSGLAVPGWEWDGFGGT